MSSVLLCLEDCLEDSPQVGLFVLLDWAKVQMPRLDLFFFVCYF